MHRPLSAASLYSSHASATLFSQKNHADELVSRCRQTLSFPDRTWIEVIGLRLKTQIGSGLPVGILPAAGSLLAGSVSHSLHTQRQQDVRTAAEGHHRSKQAVHVLCVRVRLCMYIYGYRSDARWRTAKTREKK